MKFGEQNTQREESKSNRLEWRKYSVVVLFLIFMLYLSWIEIEQAPKNRSLLQAEFDLIRPLPSAVLVESSAIVKSGHGTVGSTYRTSDSVSDIFAYYSNELQMRGWQYYGERAIKDWGRDFGGKILEFCKGQYMTSIQYAGKHASYGWTFGVDVSFGSNHCK
ncbi:hypothetical protein [Leptospira licerasiae]|uniref:Uncharacterized protein n=1 Tax=Leptospira licerasiae str. MMD4847 TaxID=1049971 RepID=A0ABN0HE37_9LEPT|nr:hypothetical protein [Leptospira licerasiae]EJZ43877.1 hypothetical protein LEP1GSC178_2013 [Leptospira licerasiae str. MMD4847]